MISTSVIEPDFEAIPRELRALPRWVVWKDKKVPYLAECPTVRASVSDRNTWATFSQAKNAYKRGGVLGVGFVLDGDGVVGIDLDNCIHLGNPKPAALDFMSSLGCEYVEVSPSGKGLRGFGYGDVGPGKRGKIDELDVELYSQGRYLTVTGAVVRSGPLVVMPKFAEYSQGLLRSTLQRSTEENTSNLLFSSVGIPPSAMPVEPGQRNQCLFYLARYLKAKGPVGAKASDFRAILIEWHRKALPHIRTKEFAETWSDFLHAWEKVKQPVDIVMNQVMEGIDRESSLPFQFKDLGYGPKAIHLVQICIALQAHHGSEPFFISARKAAELLGGHFTESAKILRALVLDGVIEEVSKGARGVASRYRLLG